MKYEERCVHCTAQYAAPSEPAVYIYCDVAVHLCGNARPHYNHNHSSSPSPPSLLSTSSPPSRCGTAVYTLVAHSLAGLSAGTPGTYFPELRSAHLTPTFFASAQHSLAPVTSIQYGPTLYIFLLLKLVESERWVRFYTSEK